MISPIFTDSSLPTTRNGRLQACEPCRKRKLACDHALPACSRCRKRDQVADCTYVSPPLSRSIRGVASVPTGRSHRQPSASFHGQMSLHSNQPLSTATQFDGTPSTATFSQSQPDNLDVSMMSDGRDIGRTPVIHSQTSHNVGTEPHLPDQVPSQSGRPAQPHVQNNSGAPATSILFSDRSGFLGPSSFSSIFWENQDNLGSATRPAIVLDCDQSPMVAATTRLACDTLKTSIEVLKDIPTRECCRSLLSSQKRWLNIGITECHERMWETYGRNLQSRTEEALEEFAQDLHSNSLKPFHEPQDPQHYVDGFTRRNIRWEALGMLFVNCKLFQKFIPKMN